MLIRMDYLSNNIFAHLGAEESKDTAFVNVRNVHIWDGTYSKSTAPVYVLYASELSGIDFSVSEGPWVLVCIQDIPLKDHPSGNGNIHYVLLPDSCSVADAVNTMTAVFSNTTNSLELFGQVLNAVTNPGSKPQFAENISEMINCPAALVDDSFNVLSAACCDLSAEEWTTFLSQKQRLMTRLPQNYNYEGFYLSPLKQPLGQYEYEVFFPLYADNTTQQLEGAIYFLSPNLTLPTDYSEILHFTAHALSWLLWKHVRQSQGSHASLNHPLVTLLLEMLYGSIPDEEKMKQVLSSCTYNVNRDFVLLVAEASAAMDEEYNPMAIANVFTGFFPEALTICFSGDVLTLLPAFYLQEDGYDELWKKFSDYLAEIQCYAGFSTVFHSVDKYFLHHYIRAMTAARIARETEEEKRYSAYNDESLFNIMADGLPPSNLIGLCDPNLIELIEHDKKFGTEYYYTLCCYWQLDRDHNRVCNYMHIHKNTLYYRIAKIKVLLHQDIDRHASFMQLALSAAILEALGKTPRYRIADDESKKNKWLFNFDSIS